MTCKGHTSHFIRLRSSDCPPLLQARVSLSEAGDAILVGVPGLAALVEVAQGANGADDLVWSLEELHTETTGDVEWNVAMHQPCTWVVGWERYDEVSTGWSSMGVASDRVRQVVSDTLATASTCSNDVEVVAVKMDRMGQRSIVLDEPISPARARDGETVVTGWES